MSGTIAGTIPRHAILTSSNIDEKSAEDYDQVYQPNSDGQTADFHNEASTSHEVIGGAAAFAAMAMYERRQKQEGLLPLSLVSLASPQPPLTGDSQTGKEVSHGFAKECIAGLAGFEADKLAESKGEDFFDKERAKHEAKKRAEEMYDSHYGQQGDNFQYDENNRYDGFQNRPPPQMDRRQEEFIQRQYDQY